ncbi:MAG: histidine kinase [Oryzihumus sp.]
MTLPDAASLRSTSMPTEPVIEPVPATDASLDAQLLALFFDRMPMGVAVFDTDMRLQRCNKTWQGFYEHYLDAPPDFTSPGRHIFEMIPGSEDTVLPLFENALAGRTVRQAAHRIAIPGRETYWDVVFAPLYADGRVVGVVDIVTDATDRVLRFRRMEARIATFTRVAAGMSVDQPLETTLREVVAAVSQTTEAVACSIMCWDEDSDVPPRAFVDEAFAPGYAEALAAAWGDRAFRDVEVADLPRLGLRRGFRSEAVAEPAFARLHPFWQEPFWEDAVGIPLVSSGRIFGELDVYLRPGQSLTEDDETYLVALADQAAVAAQNATLFRTAAQNATLVERQRLARDLHDSVSQALFSMTLHARAAERHLGAAGLGEDSAPAQEVGRLRELTQGALAEMRALIFELRPGALAEEGLASALAKQAAALSAREQVPIEVEAPTTRIPLPEDVEEHLYRLVLEALHNALKHADASRLAVVLGTGSRPDGIPVLRVEVSDDGRGFDPAAPRPGHLGLGTMRERAVAAGAELVVDSTPGQGTRVVVEQPLPG